jgi:hypothetical protein
MTIPTSVVSEREWNVQDYRFEGPGAEAGLLEYTPRDLAGGRT